MASEIRGAGEKMDFSVGFWGSGPKPGARSCAQRPSELSGGQRTHVSQRLQVEQTRALEGGLTEGYGGVQERAAARIASPCLGLRDAS